MNPSGAKVAAKVSNDTASSTRRAAPKGRIITFYSYKGGTGRSMALANVAWILALQGERVLIVDWDLEAPGVHRYFHPFLKDKDLQETEGLLDFVMTLAGSAASSEAPLEEAHVDIVDYVTMLEWPAHSPIKWETFGPRAGIDLLIAGRQGPGYSKNLNAFNWIDFYERLDGRRLLDIARRQMKGLYDYVLIDSRTGVSDTSGICTIEMPDTLVVCFTLNDQSINGASSVAESVRKTREERPVASAEPPFQIFPVPTRVEIGSERNKRQIALALAQQKFSSFLDPRFRDSRNKYWGRVQLPYFAFYAFEEIPAIFGDPADEDLSLTTPLKQIARFLTGDETLEVPGFAADDNEAARIRKEILGWYLRPGDPDTADPVQQTQNVYDDLNGSDRKLMKKLMLRLVQVFPTSPPSPYTLITADIDPKLAGMVTTLCAVGVLHTSAESLFISDRKIVENWHPLRQWITDDQAFLLWRQNLSVSARLWHSGGRTVSDRLSGKRSEEALEWLRGRRDDLDTVEIEFIEASSAEVKKVESKTLIIDLPGGGLLFVPRTWIKISLAALVVIVALAAGQQYLSHRKLKIARAEATLAFAKQEAEKDPLKAVLLLSELNEYEASDADRKFALQVANQAYPEAVIHGTVPFVSVDVAPGGNLMVAATNAGADLYSTTKWAKVATIAKGTPILSAGFNGWGTGLADRVVTLAATGVVQTWDLTGKQMANNGFSLATGICTTYGTLFRNPEGIHFVGATNDVVVEYRSGGIAKITAPEPFCRFPPLSDSKMPDTNTEPPVVNFDGNWAVMSDSGHLIFVNLQDWTERPVLSQFELPVAVYGNNLILDNTRTGPSIRRGQSSTPWVAAKSALSHAAFSRDGKFAAASTGNDAFWAPLDGSVYVPLTGHSGVINAITFDAAGKNILTASSDNTIRIWPTEKKAPDPNISWADLITYLRTSTRACLSAENRMQWLNEDASEAKNNHQACEARH